MEIELRKALNETPNAQAPRSWISASKRVSGFTLPLRQLCLAALAFAAAVIPTVGGAQDSAGLSIKQPEMTPSLNLGKMNYEAYCAECHGIDTAGTDKGPTFLHRVYHPGHHGDAAFFIAPKEGAKAHHWQFGDMKPVEGVTDAQLEKILEYVRAMQKANGVF